MLIESAGLEDEQFWGLDQEIEQIERLANVWKRQADMHQEGLLGESMKHIAAGYMLHLKMLRAARLGAAALEEPLGGSAGDQAA
jgi:hypothetical protein